MSNPLPSLNEFEAHAPETLVRTGYLSHAHGSLGPDDLVDIRITSLRNNRVLNIGGVLVTEQAKVFQILEGPSCAVQGLLGNIAKDPRHHSLQVFAVTSIEERKFQNWGMAVRSLNREREPHREIFDSIFDEFKNARSPLVLDEERISFFQKLAKNSSRDLWFSH